MSNENPERSASIDAPQAEGSAPDCLRVEDGELSAVQNMRRASVSLMQEIFRFDIERDRLKRRWFETEARVQDILLAAGRRLGIPRSLVWQVADDGRVLHMTDEGMVPLTLERLTLLKEGEEG